MPKTIKPLKIYVRSWMQPEERRTVHEFYTRRLDFTAEELRQAQVVEIPTKRDEVFKQSRTLPQNRLASPPFSQITFNHMTRELDYQQHFPYPEIFSESGPRDGHLLVRGGRGLSAEWETKVFGYLLQKYSRQTPVNQIAPSPKREKQFAKLKLADGSSLATHYAVFARQSEANRQNIFSHGAGI